MFCSRLALSLPQVVTFSNGSTITYFYAADGTKVRTVHVINGTTTQTDYCGNVIYENGAQKLLLTEEGYYDFVNGGYCYYLKDHQGNNRVVINSSGTVKETNHYYPFGGLFASSTIQPFKYNGKEFDSKNGLNWYDYGARHYDATLGRWHVVDPLADKYYKYSPYTYCANSPLLLVDPDGKQVIIPPAFLGVQPPILGTSNPVIATSRFSRLFSSSDKAVRGLSQEQHHIIPKSLKGSDVVKAAKDGGFKIDGKGNKISVDKFSKATGKGQHGKHPNYTEQIKNMLKKEINRNQDKSPQKALDAVNKVISKAKNMIENNPNTKINDLNLERIVVPIDNTKVIAPKEYVIIKRVNP